MKKTVIKKEDGMKLSVYTEIKNVGDLVKLLSMLPADSEVSFAGSEGCGVISAAGYITIEDCDYIEEMIDEFLEEEEV